jgi:acetyl esterase/lipase
MSIKSSFIILFFAVVMVSCSKTDSTPAPVNIAEKTMLDVAYGVDPAQKMDIYLPANRSAGTTKVIILIHGGGWTSGSKADFATTIDTLKKRLPDYAIVNINYRLAAWPSNLFPTQELDTKAAVDFIYGNRTGYVVSDKFVLLGASAGAHLSLLEAYKYPSPVKIKAVVDFFGPTDMTDMYNNPGAYPALSIALLLGGTPTSNPSMYQQSSPLYLASATSCPTIILQGGLDPLVNHVTQSEALKTKLTALAVVNQYVYYPTGDHGNWDAATYTDAFDKIQAFLTANVH